MRRGKNDCSRFPKYSIQVFFMHFNEFKYVLFFFSEKPINPLRNIPYLMINGSIQLAYFSLNILEEESFVLTVFVLRDKNNKERKSFN